MAARRRSRDSTALKTVRLRLAPQLTREEARRLEARAAADFRPVANYIAYLIARNLKAKRRSGRPTSAKPGDDRIGYELVIPITIPDRRELEERARRELRSMSSYVAKLIVEELDRV